MISIIMQKITFVLASLTMCSQQMMHLNGRLREWTFHLTGFSPISKQNKYQRCTVAHKGHAAN